MSSTVTDSDPNREGAPPRWPRAEMLQMVERSPECVLSQDKAGWLALFAKDGVTEDPVGTAPNGKGARRARDSGEDDLGRFWDTFIAGNEIRFCVAADVVAGDEVVREVVINTRLWTGLSIEVPAHLVYQLEEEEGGLRIRRLRAVWDLRQRSVKALGAGLLGLYTLLAVSYRMFAVQGVRGVWGYTLGLLVGIFGRGRRVVSEFAKAVEGADAGALEALFGSGGAKIEYPAGRALSASQFVDALGPGARLLVSQSTPAGWLTSFCFELAGKAGGARGMALFEFDPTTKQLSSARFFSKSVSKSE